MIPSPSNAQTMLDPVTDPDVDPPDHDRATPGLVLLILSGWVAWRPAETFASTAVLVAAVLLALAVWGWKRTSSVAGNSWLVAAGAGCVLTASGLSGWDGSSAVTILTLLAAVAALIWLASREQPSKSSPAILALAISGLAVWGIWQVTGGAERAALAITDLPESIQFEAADRLASGRAFASQILPSHLAVLFATALPLLLVRLGRRWSALPWAVASVLCVAGLWLTRSPIGITLALGACLALAVGRGRLNLVWVVVVLGLVLAVVVVGRGDVLELEPVQLRVDNWRTALWVWSTAPATGVGIGGFAQAAQAVPFEVGNRPRHAHCLPLEWLAELGLLGFGVACVLGVALWQLARDLWPKRPELAIAITVIPIHNLVDFSFYGSGVALPWAILVGWAVAIRRGSSVRNKNAPGRVVLVAAMAVALAAVVLHVTSRAVEEVAAGRETAELRFAGALEARRIAPWRLEPLGLAATAALEEKDIARLELARSELEKARWLRPRSSALAGLRARLGQALGEAPTTVADAWDSMQQQPSNRVSREFYDRVLDQLDVESP